MVDIREYIDKSKAAADGVLDSVEEGIEDYEDFVRNWRDGLERGAASAVEDIQLFLENHQVASIVVLAVTAIVVIGAFTAGALLF